MYYPLLDRLTSELNTRFSSETCGIMEMAGIFHPKNINGDQASCNKISGFAKKYRLNEECIRRQFQCFANSDVCQEYKHKYRVYQDDLKLRGTTFSCVTNLARIGHA